MKILLTLLIVSWLIPNEIDMNNRTFLREVQTVFSVTPDKLVRLETQNMDDLGQSGQFFRVQSPEKGGFAWVGRVNSCRAGGCSDSKLPADPVDLSAEFFDYFILFDVHGSIRSVRVFNYQASHGHGIMSRGWLRQFNGYSGDKKLEPGKNVDAISGATISVQAITADVERRTLFLKTFIGKN
jgi:hypothetical protein